MRDATQRADELGSSVIFRLLPPPNSDRTEVTVTTGARTSRLTVANDAASITGAVEQLCVDAWLDMASIEPGVIVSRYPRGADSLMIVRVDGSAEARVVKVGPVEIVRAEVDLVRAVNDHHCAERIVFPRVLAFVEHAGIGVNVMEAARAEPLDEDLFCDGDRTTPVHNAISRLEPFLELLGNLHRRTVAPGVPEVAAYLYRGRFSAVPHEPGFIQAAERVLGDRNGEALGLLPWISAEYAVEGLASLRTRLARHIPELLPESSSVVHGDPHLRNMLRRVDGTPCFIDPRTVWDGRRRRDEGRGDPTYDFATLLHSIWPMSSVLHSVESGRRGPVWDVTANADAVHFSSLLPQTALINAIEACFVDQLDWFDDASRSVRVARLRIGAAAALAGWLKYPAALPTVESWSATYFAMLWYLQRGIEEMEQHDEEE